MSESRICPVCENEIPEDARFLCPHCQFELKGFYDDNYISNRRRTYQREEDALKGIKKVYFNFAGILGVVVAQIVYFKWGPYIEGGWALFCMPFYILLSLPLGLYTGKLSFRLEKKLNRGLIIMFAFLILTFILSTVFCVFLRVILRLISADIIGIPW